jgi:hypothetical protein
MRAERKTAESEGPPKTGYCVFIDALFEGSVPSVFGGDDKPIVFQHEKKPNSKSSRTLSTGLKSISMGSAISKMR